MAIMLAHNLRMLRIKNKYTLEDIAEIIDVSRQSVAKWESGESYPDIEKCVKLASLYKTTLDNLVKESMESLIRRESDNETKFMFGITEVDTEGRIKLPQKAMEMFDIVPKDYLLVLGDTNKGIAVVKCEEINTIANEF